MDTVTIRQATLTDLPLLLNYRRAMAAEIDSADEVAVNRMMTALEPYLRSAIPEGRWHAWIAEPGGCGSVEIVQWVPGKAGPNAATCMDSRPLYPRSAAAVSDGHLPRP